LKFLEESLKVLDSTLFLHLDMMQYNYGGVQAKDILPLDAAETADSSQDATRNGSTEIVSNWNIAEYLPKATLVLFQSIGGWGGKGGAMGIDLLNFRRIALKRSDLFCLLLVLPWINRTTCKTCSGRR
jgi:hypothetical protein